MDEVLKHLSNIYAMDRATLGVIGALCAVAAFTIKDYLANHFMALFVLPVLFVFSVLAKYLFILGEMYPFNKLDQWLMWTVTAAIIGNIIGISLVAALGRLREALRPAPSVGHIPERKTGVRPRSAA
jgi:putative effector of murein hydrolase